MFALLLRLANETVIAEYFYDALGRRVRKVIENTDGYDGEFHYVWNPGGQLIEVYKVEDDVPRLTRAFVHAGSASGV